MRTLYNYVPIIKSNTFNVVFKKNKQINLIISRPKYIWNKFLKFELSIYTYTSTYNLICIEGISKLWQNTIVIF